MILNNLLSNAVKNTAGNKNITVTVSTRHGSEHEFPEGKILIEVKHFRQLFKNQYGVTPTECRNTKK